MRISDKKEFERYGMKGYMIDLVHLSSLVSSYHKHFNEYSNAGEKSSNQLILPLVWKYYVDYKRIP